ncbi:MAG: SDR family oxidoreductase [Oscillospiraceae bacterium]|nr:SDR family oxidoreductase [Oscillospiraceae bacterium]
MQLPPIENMTGVFDVRGKNVVVTGGNRGIGLGISRAFAQSGCNVAILCRNEASGRAAAEDLRQYGTEVFAVPCDTSSLDSVKAAAAETFRHFDSLDVLVNNAGVSTVVHFLDDTDLGEWNRVLNTNLHGPANCVYCFAPKMRDGGRGGSIINISSIGGQCVGNTRDQPMAPYNASKAALNHFTRFLAIDLGDYGIRVNAIAPGPTHSDLDKDLPPSALAAIENGMPMHRFGMPLEIGALCVFLASPAAVQITGNVIEHDGGMHLIG